MQYDDYDWISEEPMAKNSTYWWVLGIVSLVSFGLITYLVW
jgi:hypothetical protein